MQPYSCDTFVALPSATAYGAVIFGKNSDRPKEEVQEVVHFPAMSYAESSSVECTYISIAQAAKTSDVVLSKPAWLWGAEMGANEHGVCIGNEAVSTKVESDADKEEALLGMDLVRLGLERCQTAKQALDVMTALLEEHGQGGPCTDNPDAITTYHNSFIIADPSEAWVLETAGRFWAAEQVTEGVRNISNQLSIGDNITAMSVGLKEFCQEKSWWNPAERAFNFTAAMANDYAPTMFGPDESPCKRFAAGKQMLADKSCNGEFNVADMMSVLRDQESRICRIGTGPRGIASTGSQVSVLFPPSTKPSIHWFTATTNPACSIFKPYVMNNNGLQSDLTVSPKFGTDPAKDIPRFSFKVDRSHKLHRVHSKLNPLPGDRMDNKFKQALKMEEKNLSIMEKLLAGEDVCSLVLDQWWKASVQEEYELYME